MAVRKQKETPRQSGQVVQSGNEANTSPADKEQGGPLPEITVRVYLVRNSRSKLMATANVNIAGAFAVHGFRIFDSRNGLFVKEPEQSYVKDGTELTRPVFFPITKDARDVLYGHILRSYELTMEKEMGQRADDPGYLPSDEDAPPQRQHEPPSEDYVLPEHEITPEDDLPFDFGPSM